MLDSFDYKEPSCVLCGGEDFYNFSQDKPTGCIPIRSIFFKLDTVLEKNDMAEAERLLTYWLSEAKLLRDKRGELSILSEQMGLYRKIGDKAKGLESVYAGLRLIEELDLKDKVSGATIMLNGATTLKAFMKAGEGIKLYEKVESVYDRCLDKCDSKKAGLYNNFALAYVDLGRYEIAEKQYLKAIKILEHNEKSENELAITYINLAHLYEKIPSRENEVYNCVEKAIDFLNSPKVERNGYHAFVCSKCIKSIDYFGYFIAKEGLEKRVKEIYERT